MACDVISAPFHLPQIRVLGVVKDTSVQLRNWL